MAWEGKAFWGGVGWLVGGPVGGVIGAIIGHAVDSDDDETAAVEAQRQRRFEILFYSLFGMAAKLAKADGVVTRDEIDLLTQFMRETLELDADGQNAAIQIFNEAKNSSHSIEDYALVFYEEFAGDEEGLSNMLLLLFSVAAADGVLHPNEERMLHSVSRIFGLNDEGFRQVKIQFFGDTDQWYAVLECSPHDDNDTIKRQYKRLAIEYHPDRLASFNLSPAIVQLAKEKLQQINEAYDFIKKQRGFN